MVKIMENPPKMDDWGGKTDYFRKHPYSPSFFPLPSSPNFIPKHLLENPRRSSLRVLGHPFQCHFQAFLVHFGCLGNHMALMLLKTQGHYVCNAYIEYISHVYYDYYHYHCYYCYYHYHCYYYDHYYCYYYYHYYCYLLSFFNCAIMHNIKQYVPHIKYMLSYFAS